jgi:hypothetical protein
MKNLFFGPMLTKFPSTQKSLQQSSEQANQQPMESFNEPQIEQSTINDTESEEVQPPQKRIRRRISMPDLRLKPTKSSRYEVNWNQQFQHIYNEGLTLLQKFTPAFNPKGESAIQFRNNVDMHLRQPDIKVHKRGLISRFKDNVINLRHVPEDQREKHLRNLVLFTLKGNI